MEELKAGKWIVAVAILFILLSLLLYRNPWYIFAPVLIYGLVYFIAGLYYRRSKIGYWVGLLLAIPPIGIFVYQFSRRLYYWFAYGGEEPDGTGSPMAFIMGFAFEAPFYVLLCFLAITLISDRKTLNK